jgi:hypothetical protein
MTAVPATRAPTGNGAGRTPIKPLAFQRIAPGVTSARIVLNAVEGFGKSTLGGFAPDPVILMARGETGFETLRKKNLVPDADSLTLESWADVLTTVTQLEDTKHKTVVFDALGGFERLCHEEVCRRDFNNDWGEKGFQAYMRGYDVAVSDWLKLLQRLDQLRAKRDVNVIFLSHSKAKTFKNPMGPDFDRYTADCHDKTWSPTHKWADVVLFGTFVTVVQEKKGRTKGIGGTERIAYTQRTDAYDAKNRFGMPEKIDFDAPETMWSKLWDAISGMAAAPMDDAPPM